MVRAFAVLFSAAVLIACGSHNGPNDSGTLMNTDAGFDAGMDTDAGDDAGVDSGAPDSGTPDAGWVEAAHPPAPQSMSYGGPVLAHPKLVPITFTNDPLSADIDTFLAAFPYSSYWGDRVQEYGIAPPVLEATVHSGDVMPASVTDVDLKAWLAAQLGSDAGFPQPDGETMYVLFTPPGTTVTLTGYGDSCTTFHGFHDEATFDGGQVPYALVSRCDTLPEIPVTGIQYVSAVMSHEVLEGLADPYPFTNPAFQTTDDDHAAWMFATGGEVGDLCALIGDAFYTPDDFPYTVQRIWSNQRAAAGLDPCTPDLGGEPYFQTAAVTEDEITVMYQGQSGVLKGALVPLGTTKDVELDLYSSGPTSHPWTVQAFEYSAHPGHVQLSLDQSQGENGDKLLLHVSAIKKDPVYQAELVVVVSKLGTRRNLWFFFVGN